MRPGDPICKYFRIIADNGTAVPGAVIAALTLTAWHMPYGGAPATWTHGATLTEVATGFYALTFTAPPTAGQWALWIVPTDTTRQIEFASVSGETENQDLDSLHNAVSRPIIGVSGQGTIGQQVPLSLVAKRYRVVTFTFVDEDGDPIDMTVGTTYTNYRWSVRDPNDQTATPPKFDQTTGITGGLGFVRVTILEGSSFFAALPEGVNVEDDYNARHELVADLVAVAGETVALVPSSPLTLTRREEGT